MLKYSIEEIKETLQAIAETNLKDTKSVKSNGLILEGVLLNRKFTISEEKELDDFLSMNGLFDKLQSLYEAYETELEVSFSENILINRLSSVHKYEMYERFEGLIKNEIKIANIRRQEKILFIGSGPFPISAILLNKLTGCGVDCYEKKKEAC